MITTDTNKEFISEFIYVIRKLYKLNQKPYLIILHT